MPMAVAMARAESSYTADRTQTVSASTSWETHAPLATKASAAASCLASSRVASRTRTLVSTACMALSHVRAPALFQLLERTRRRLCLTEKCLVHILEAVLAHAPYHDLIPLLRPLEHGARP